MRRLLLWSLVLLAAVPYAAAGAAVRAAKTVPHLIIPGGQNSGPLVLTPPTSPLILPERPKLIIPETGIIAPPPVIIPAARPMTAEEAAPAVLPSQDGLKKLADSLAVPAEEGGAGQDNAPEGALGSAFDGSKLPDAGPALAYFAAPGPLAPKLGTLETAARSLWSLLLPRIYKKVPVTVAYDRGQNPQTGHTWTPEKGHLIELAPVSPDSKGEVPSAFGLPGQAMVQHKIENLMLMAHEYAHVLFDHAVRKEENHPPASAYSAMTEGFAVTMEQLFIDRLLTRPAALGLSPRDVGDLASLAAARRTWLAAVDSHYSEGVESWRTAYDRGGEQGLLTFLASLSAKRLISVPRSDPSYQLAAGDPELLSAYLGKDAAHPDRLGLEAFARAAKGEALSEAESLAAASVIEKAGPDGRRRLFERVLLSDKRIKEPRGGGVSGKWFEKEAEVLPSVEPAFALARLSPAGASELAQFLAQTVASGGSARLFERRGPNEKANAIIAGADALPWDEAGRGVWMSALMRWLVG